MKKIMRPHEDQKGEVYIRVSKTEMKLGINTLTPVGHGLRIEGIYPFGRLGYNDAAPGSRVISSSRVEDDVETGDFLRVCAEEGLDVMYNVPWGGARKARWFVAKAPNHIGWVGAPTLRQAYEKYQARQ